MVPSRITLPCICIDSGGSGSFAYRVKSKAYSPMATAINRWLISHWVSESGESPRVSRRPVGLSQTVAA